MKLLILASIILGSLDAQARNINCRMTENGKPFTASTLEDYRLEVEADNYVVTVELIDRMVMRLVRKSEPTEGVAYSNSPISNAARQTFYLVTSDSDNKISVVCESKENQSNPQEIL